jgi:hypothetical protein
VLAAVATTTSALLTSLHGLTSLSVTPATSSSHLALRLTSPPGTPATTSLHGLTSLPGTPTTTSTLHIGHLTSNSYFNSGLFTTNTIPVAPATTATTSNSNANTTFKRERRQRRHLFID